MDRLKDIKPLVEISDFSFYAYIFALIISFLLFFILFYKLMKIFKKKRVDKRKEMIETLRNIDIEDSKRAAYTITKLGRELVWDDRSFKIFEELLRRLQRYKYKKEVSKLDDEVKRYLQLFLETVDE